MFIAMYGFQTFWIISLGLNMLRLQVEEPEYFYGLK